MTDYQNYSPFWVVWLTLDHIRYLLFETSYPGWMLNTVIVSVASTDCAFRLGAGGHNMRSSSCASKGAHHRPTVFLAYLVARPLNCSFPLASHIVFRVGIFDARLALILTYPASPDPVLHLAV